MKIINRGKWGINASCPTCKSELLVETEDVKYRAWHDYGGGSDSEFYFDCPVCKDTPTLPSGKIPKVIGDPAREAFSHTASGRAYRECGG